MNVLLVCTANRVRSPMAETLTRTYLKGSTVTSAGTHARDGDPMTSEALAALRRHAYEVPMSFRSRALSRSLIADADLVLTMETAHRAAVVTAEPRALRRTFTVREFGRLLAGAPYGRNIVATAAARRGTVPTGPDDITDPNGHGAPAHDACLALIKTALAPWLTGRGGPPC